MADQAKEICDECGLPLVECSALTIARSACESYLRDHGYAGLKARDRAAELVKDPKANA